MHIREWINRVPKYAAFTQGGSATQPPQYISQPNRASTVPPHADVCHTHMNRGGVDVKRLAKVCACVGVGVCVRV